MSQNILSYTSRDYSSIKTDLVNAIPNLTDIWTSREEADPGMVLITLMAALGDNLSFNMDQQSFEFFGQTVTQRKNAARILDLIGYKMHWYKSATLEITLYNNSLNDATLLFNPTSQANTQRVISSSINGAAEYLLLNPDETPANWNTNKTVIIPAGGSQTFQAVQGTLQSIHFNTNSIDTNNRYYLPISKIDQDHIWLADSEKYQWYQTSSLNELTETLPRFEFGIDEYSLPYIEFVPYWRQSFGEIHEFTLYYLTTRGSAGSVATNVLDTVVGLTNTAYNKGKLKRNDIVVAHGSNTVPNSKLSNQPGKDPQAARDAYLDSRNYIGTYNTLVTLSDYEKFMLRLGLISAAKAVDGQLANEYNATLPSEESYNKLYPVTYESDTYALTNGTSQILLTRDTSYKIYDERSAQVLPLYGSNTADKSIWYKAYTTKETSQEFNNKHSAIISSGLKDNNLGALQLVHDGSAGDIVIGLDREIPEGTYVASWKFKLELPSGVTQDSITCKFMEQFYESTGLNLIPNINKKIDTADGPVYYVEVSDSYNFNCHGSKNYFIKFSVPALPDSTKVTITLDEFKLNTITVDSSESTDILNGLGDFCTNSKLCEIFTGTVGQLTYLFDIDTKTNELIRYTSNTDGTSAWISATGSILDLGIDTYLFQTISPEFAPYNLQMYMIAGDFLIKSAASSYTYAIETPITAETVDNKPMGYIDYMLHDNLVGTADDSLMNQTNISKYKLFNTELSYAPVRKFPFFIDGQLHLKNPVAPAEANHILGKVFIALQTYFNAYNLELGEKIVFNKIISVINSADSNIDYFDAGANNSHGSLIVYPTTDDYNPNKYNGSDYSYGKYDVNIDPKYFNLVSMQHYEDMLQANNSIVYWGNTLSGHLSIAPDSITEKSTPLMKGISAALSYIVSDTGVHGIVSMTPDVADLYEFRTFSNVVLDINRSVVVDRPATVALKQSVNFQYVDSEYVATIDNSENNLNLQSFIFQFIKTHEMNADLPVDTGSTILCGFKKVGNDNFVLSALNVAGQPDVSNYFNITSVDNKITITTEIDNTVSTATQVFYLYTEALSSYESYFEDDWSTSKLIANMNKYTDSNTGYKNTIQYLQLSDSDHLWGIYSQYAIAADLDIPDNIYERLDNGFVVGVRAKETLTSKASSIITTNYAVMPVIESGDN